MRTHLEFQSPAFEPEQGEDDETNPGIFGRRLARFLADEFAALGYGGPNIIAEEHGWWVMLDNPEFPLALICASFDAPSGWLVQINPSQPFVRKMLFKKIDTTKVVEKVAHHLETILTTSGSATDLRWWDDRESGRN